MSNAERPVRAVCVFCGASTGSRPQYAEAARAVGADLARRGLTLVYGAGNVGLMGVLADAALAGGGRVIGVIPEALVARELAHQGLTELHVVGTMHQRKALMADLSGAFLALPGGFGTADETFEILTWAQLGLHDKPVGLLDAEGYFGPLLTWLDRAVEDRLLRQEHRDMLLTGREPAELIGRLVSHRPGPAVAKWIDEGDR